MPYKNKNSGPMELINYLTQIIVSVIIFLLLCFLGEQLKKFVENHYRKIINPEEYFPKEEILSFKQVTYLILILFIYIFIISLFYNIYFKVSSGLLLINCLIDIILSLYLIIFFYDFSTRSKIISVFLMPLSSISFIVFGGTLLRYWDFIRIPTLLFLVTYIYNKFIRFTEKNNLQKLILILISIIFLGLVLTMFLENQNPINSLAMVSNAFTSNGYIALGSSVNGVLTSTFLVWSGYIISGVATATLAATIVHRNSKKKFDKLEEKIDNLERIIIQSQENESEDKKD